MTSKTDSLTSGSQLRQRPERMVVLVTGASTGIGRCIIERLASHGHFVYAGARRNSDLEALAEISGVEPMRLDVTSPEDISATRQAIEDRGQGLHGLVNNAGVLASGPILASSVDELSFLMDANVYGPWRMVQAFAGLLAASKGRVVNIGSINGIAPSPGYAAYFMSKYAVEAFTDILACELSSAGVDVSLIEPGSFRSRLIQNQLQRTGAGKDNASFIAQAPDPGPVAAAVELALLETIPRRRYLVAANEREARYAIESHLQRLAELNDSQEFEYSSDKLVEMLVAALGRAAERDSRPRPWPGT